MTVEQQFIPALAIASAVGSNFKKKRMKRMFILLFLLFVCQIKAQEITEASYKLEFLKATFKEKNESNEIIIYLKYTPKKDNKTLISGRITYSLGENGIEKTEVLEKSKHGIIIHGQNIKEEKSKVYKLFKNTLDFDSTEEFFIIEFRLINITEKYIEKMTFTYGLWEPSNEKLRFEKKFNIEIER